MLVIRHPWVSNVASTVEPPESTSHFFFFRGRVFAATPFIPLSRDRLWACPSLESVSPSFAFLCLCRLLTRFVVVPPTCYRLLRLGMPEMLKPTSLIIGAGLSLDVACLTDGRFSGGYVVPFLLLSHTLVAGLRAYPAPTFIHVLSEHRKLHPILRLSFLCSLSFTEALRDPRHMWDRTLSLNLLHPSIRSFITTLSLQGDNRREIEVPVCAWGLVLVDLPPIPSFAPFLQMVAFPFLPRTRNSSRPKFGGGFFYGRISLDWE